jgi:hypothetical protein
LAESVKKEDRGSNASSKERYAPYHALYVLEDKRGWEERNREEKLMCSACRTAIEDESVIKVATE